MSERDDYPHGVPCWVTCLVDDVPAAVDFYGELFGWASDLHEEAGYAMAHLRGREVAGIGSLSEAGPGAAAAWITNVRVDNAAAAAREAQAAGGAVLADDLDMAPAGRLTRHRRSGRCGLRCVGGGRAKGRAGRQRTGRLEHEPPAGARPGRRADVLSAAVRLGDRAVRASDDAAAPGLRRRRARAAGPRDVVAAAAPPGGDAARWAVDFWVADADAAAATALARGGRVLEAVHDAPPFREARLADPEGAEFTVSQLVV